LSYRTNIAKADDENVNKHLFIQVL